MLLPVPRTQPTSEGAPGVGRPHLPEAGGMAGSRACSGPRTGVQPNSPLLRVARKALTQSLSTALSRGAPSSLQCLQASGCPSPFRPHCTALSTPLKTEVSVFPCQKEVWSPLPDDPTREVLTPACH